MKRETTTWSKPKTNIFAATLDLYNALNSGHNAVLIKEWNENCMHPITKKNIHDDFRAYESFVSHISSRDEIMNNAMTDYEKYLSLNYKNCFGFQEAVDRYYQTGELTMDNIRGIGKSHLVKVTDLIELLRENDYDGSQRERIESLENTYIHNNKGWYDFFKLKRGYSRYTIKKFKKKIWVVALLKQDEEKPKQSLRVKTLLRMFKIIGSVTKYFPEKSVTKGREFTYHNWSVGNFHIQIEIPKKFSFK